MKTIALLLIATCTFFSIEAQELENDTPDPYFKTHEIKANGLYLVFGAVDVTYEYLLNDESALGINGLVPFDDEIINDIEYYVAIYYRHYFGKKYAAGFFLEGFGMLNSAERDFDLFFLDDDQEDYITDFALGIGFGGKWVTKGGFVGELSYGLGRNLFHNDETDIDFIGKAGITIGYRF